VALDRFLGNDRLSAEKQRKLGRRADPTRNVTATGAGKVQSACAVSRWHFRPRRFAQRPRFDEFLGEEHVAEIMQLVQRGMQRCSTPQHLTELVLQDLCVEQLLGVFPLIQRLGFIKAFIALQTDQLLAAPMRDRFGKLGLADAGGPLDQDRLSICCDR
jgi:hypothetical protein